MVALNMLYACEVKLKKRLNDSVDVNKCLKHIKYRPDAS